MSYHINSRPGQRPVPFSARLDVKSNAGSRGRVLDGILNANSVQKRLMHDQFTTTGTWNRVSLAFLRTKPLTVRPRTHATRIGAAA